MYRGAEQRVVGLERGGQPAVPRLERGADGQRAPPENDPLPHRARRDVQLAVLEARPPLLPSVRRGLVEGRHQRNGGWTGIRYTLMYYESVTHKTGGAVCWRRERV